MKVYDGKSGVKAHSSGGKSLEHSISKKTALAKKSEKELVGRTTRSVNRADAKTPQSEKRRTEIPRNTRDMQMRSSRTAQNVGTVSKEKREQTVSGEYAPRHLNVSTKSGVSASHARNFSGLKSTNPQIQRKNVHSNVVRSERTSQRSTPSKTQIYERKRTTSQAEKGLQRKARTINKSPVVSASSAPKPPTYKQFRRSPTPTHGKNYKVLKNGVIGNDRLLKRKERIIYSKRKQGLQEAKAKAVRHKTERTASGVPIPKRPPVRLSKPEAQRIKDLSKRFKSKTIKLTRLKKGQQIKLTREQSEAIKRHIAKVRKAAENAKNVSKSKTKAALGAVGKSVSVAGAAAKVATKPISAVGNKLLSQRADTQKTEDSGTEAIKLGLQTADYARTGGRAVKTSIEKSVKTVRKISKRVDRHLSKNATKRKLKKAVTKTTKKSVKTAAKGAKKAAKTAANAAKKAAQAASKAAQATAKAVANAVAKVVAFIVQTMPYSLIVIGVILIVLILCLAITQLIGGAGGSVAGGGAWLVDDENNQTPEEIYEGYKEYIEQAKSVMQTQAKDALKSKVTGFCSSDTTDPRKIIQYIDKTHNSTFYPASGADSTINPIIEAFGTDDYADYMSLLFVLMTREKQQADGVSDGEIYDFDFELEDFQEFMKTVNENSCRFGDTFVYKTAVETSGNACPSENCKTKYITGCQCGSYTDSEGRVHHYCKGHPYCPHNHTKMTVTLYTVKEYYNKDYPEIYNFTDNEKARYEASKAIIQGLLDYWE